MKRIDTAGILLVRKDRTILVLHPTYFDKNIWGIPKGIVDEGESHFDAAIRETYEETNLYLKDNKSFDMYKLESKPHNDNNKILHPYLFLEKDDSTVNWSGIDFKCSSYATTKENGTFLEVDDYKFISLDQAEETLHHAQSSCVTDIKKILDNREMFVKCIE